MPASGPSGFEGGFKSEEHATLMRCVTVVPVSERDLSAFRLLYQTMYVHSTSLHSQSALLILLSTVLRPARHALRAGHFRVCPVPPDPMQVNALTMRINKGHKRLAKPPAVEDVRTKLATGLASGDNARAALTQSRTRYGVMQSAPHSPRRCRAVNCAPLCHFDER